MLKKVWSFIKENVPVIIALVTAMLTVVYAVLRLCIYVYWNGYFTRLNMDVSLINLDFDKSIFAVIFVSIVLIVVLIFMAWVYEIITNSMKKEKNLQLKGVKKVFYKIKAIGKALLLSFLILSIINLPLIMLLAAVTQINFAISNVIVLFLLLYIMELTFVFAQLSTTKRSEKKEKLTEGDVATKIFQVLAVTLLILAVLFYYGSHAIYEKSSIQLVENGEYMITYCDGEHYVLHKVKYEDGVALLDKNAQKIVNIEDCEISIKHVVEIDVEGE